MVSYKGILSWIQYSKGDHMTPVDCEVLQLLIELNGALRAGSCSTHWTIGCGLKPRKILHQITALNKYCFTWQAGEQK